LTTVAHSSLPTRRPDCKAHPAKAHDPGESEAAILPQAPAARGLAGQTGGRAFRTGARVLESRPRGAIPGPHPRMTVVGKLVPGSPLAEDGRGVSLRADPSSSPDPTLGWWSPVFFPKKLQKKLESRPRGAEENAQVPRIDPRGGWPRNFPPRSSATTRALGVASVVAGLRWWRSFSRGGDAAETETRGGNRISPQAPTDGGYGHDRGLLLAPRRSRWRCGGGDARRESDSTTTLW
jgi:hypothetical protein